MGEEKVQFVASKRQDVCRKLGGSDRRLPVGWHWSHSSLSESQAKARVDRDVKELFQIRDPTNASRNLNRSQESIDTCLVSKFVLMVGAKESDVISCSLMW